MDDPRARRAKFMADRKMRGSIVKPVQPGREAKPTDAYTNEQLVAACRADGIDATITRDGRVLAYEHAGGGPPGLLT